MRVVDLDQRTDEWKQWRKLGVTATDSPVLFGLVPEQNSIELWAEKTGLKEPTDLSDIPAVRWGLEHEDYARSLWELKHGDIASPLCVESDANPIFRASLDGYTTNGEVLEIKCPYPDGITIMDVKIRRENSDAYKRYFIQVQHQLMVSGSLLAHLVFLDEDELIEFEISRDENVINEIKQKGEEFFKAVLEKRPPRDKTGWLPKSVEEETLWRDAAERYLEAVSLERRYRSQKEQAKTELLGMIGEFYSYADYAGVLITKEPSRPSSSVSCSKVLKYLMQKEIPITEDVFKACVMPKSESRWNVKPSPTETRELVFNDRERLRDSDHTLLSVDLDDFDNSETGAFWF